MRVFVDRLAVAFFAVAFFAAALLAATGLAAVFAFVERLAAALAGVAFAEVFLAVVALAAEVFFFVERLAGVFLAAAGVAGALDAAGFALGERFAVLLAVDFAGVFLVAAISFWLLYDQQGVPFSDHAPRTPCKGRPLSIRALARSASEPT